MKKLLILCAALSGISGSSFAQVVPPPVFAGAPAVPAAVPKLLSATPTAAAPASAVAPRAAPVAGLPAAPASAPLLGKASDSASSSELTKLNPFTGKPLSEEQARKALFSARAQAAKLEQVLGEKPLTVATEGCERPAVGKTAFDKKSLAPANGSDGAKPRLTKRARVKIKQAPLTPEYVRPAAAPCNPASTEMSLISVSDSVDGLVAKFTFRGVEVEALNGTESPLGFVSVVSERLIKVGGKPVTNLSFIGPVLPSSH